MITSPQITLKSTLLTAAVTALLLSACASQPERRGPPQDRGEKARGDQVQGKGEGSEPGKRRGRRESSGTFIKPVGVLFTGMDSNGDATVSKTEAISGIGSEWASFERKPSGAVFAQWSRRALGSIDSMPSFFSFDSDFNGVVSEEEFKDTLTQEFDRLDKDGDGLVTRSEMIVNVDAQMGRARGQGENAQRGRGGRGGGGQGGGRPQR